MPVQLVTYDALSTALTAINGGLAKRTIIDRTSSGLDFGTIESGYQSAGLNFAGAGLVEGDAILVAWRTMLPSGLIFRGAVVGSGNDVTFYFFNSTESGIVADDVLCKLLFINPI